MKERILNTMFNIPSLFTLLYLDFMAFNWIALFFRRKQTLGWI